HHTKVVADGTKKLPTAWRPITSRDDARLIGRRLQSPAAPSSPLNARAMPIGKRAESLAACPPRDRDRGGLLWRHSTNPPIASPSGCHRGATGRGALPRSRQIQS